MIKYSVIFFCFFTFTGCGRPERKMANSQKNVVADTIAIPQKNDDEAMHENRFDVERISGKSKEEVNQYLGDPDSEEKVSVKGEINDCQKASYVGGMIEVIFIRGKADWIKINDDPAMVIIPSNNNYVSVEKFQDYVFVKTFTK